MSAARELPGEILSAFRDRLTRDADRLGCLRNALAAEEAPVLSEDPRRDEIEQLAHGLVGTGATFGFAEVGAAAEDVERLAGLSPVLIAPADGEYRRLLLLAVERLQHALGAENAPGE